jgi:hypothetical protein
MARPARHQNGAYTRYEDLPPPSPEDKELFIARLLKTYTQINERSAAQRRAKLLSWADWAPK